MQPVRCDPGRRKSAKLVYHTKVLQNFLTKHKTLAGLPDNSRFYILVFSVLLSVALASWIRSAVPGDQLFYIRTEQAYGWVSLIFWYIAVMVSPLGYVFGKGRGVIKQLTFARRAIGVSAAYFACLHFAVSLWGQIGGLAGLGLLPDRYKWSLGFGAVALAVLVLMAATSFDKVVSYMTFRRWKLLHRLVYGAGILVILHVWMIGTHVAYDGIKIAAFVALVIFFGLESYRVAGTIAKRYERLKRKEYLTALFIGLWLAWVLLLVSLPGLVKNYHSENHSQQHSTVDHTGDGHE